MESKTHKAFSQDIVSGLFEEPIEKYHEARAIGSTHIRTFLKSTLQFMHMWNNPNDESTDAFLIGSALHCSVLEPDEFDKRFAVGPKDIDRRTKTGKETWADFVERSNGKEILTMDMYKMVHKMTDSIYQNQIAHELLADTQRELSARVALSNGLVVQCRPDAMKSSALIDVKTTMSIGKFASEIRGHAYPIQAAFYWFIMSSLYPEAYGEANFYWIAVEKMKAHECRVFGMDNADLKDVCERTVKPALKQMKDFFDQHYPFDLMNPPQQEAIEWVSAL